jgi:hypothetical protein
MRLYLTKPSKRGRAAMEPKRIREIPVTVDCIEVSVSGSARVPRGASPMSTGETIQIVREALTTHFCPG